MAAIMCIMYAAGPYQGAGAALLLVPKGPPCGLQPLHVAQQPISSAETPNRGLRLAAISRRPVAARATLGHLLGKLRPSGRPMGWQGAVEERAARRLAAAWARCRVAGSRHWRSSRCASADDSGCPSGRRGCAEVQMQEPGRGGCTDAIGRRHGAQRAAGCCRGRH